MDGAEEKDVVKHGEDGRSNYEAVTLARKGQGRHGQKQKKGATPATADPPSPGYAPPRAWIGHGQSGRAGGEALAPAGPLRRLRG